VFTALVRWRCMDSCRERNHQDVHACMPAFSAVCHACGRLLTGRWRCELITRNHEICRSALRSLGRATAPQATAHGAGRLEDSCTHDACTSSLASVPTNRRSLQPSVQVHARMDLVFVLDADRSFDDYRPSTGGRSMIGKRMREPPKEKNRLH